MTSKLERKSRFLQIPSNLLSRQVLNFRQVLQMLHREPVRFVYNVQANPCELGYSTLRVLLRSTRRLRLRTSTQPTCSLVVALPYSMYSSVQSRARKRDREQC